MAHVSHTPSGARRSGPSHCTPPAHFQKGLLRVMLHLKELTGGIPAASEGGQPSPAGIKAPSPPSA